MVVHADIGLVISSDHGFRLRDTSGSSVPVERWSIVCFEFDPLNRESLFE